MKLRLMDPIREFIQEGWKVTIHTEHRAHEGVVIHAVTEAYIAFTDPDDASENSWIALPWHQVVSVQYVSPRWVDAEKV